MPRNAAMKAVRADPTPLIERYVSGESMRQIAAGMGICRKSLKNVLLENDVDLRIKKYTKRKPEIVQSGEIYIPPWMPRFEPGEKVRFRSGNFRLVGITECRAGVLWLFQHIQGGWRESFTVHQLADELKKREKGDSE